MSNLKENNSKMLIGIVISNKMLKTIILNVEIRIKHPIYGKFLKRKIKIFAHDESNNVQIGDLVMVKSCRPFSKRKNHLLVEVLEKAQ